MIDAFSYDFELALEKDGYNLVYDKDENLIEDIHKLCELAFNLKHGKHKIIEI